MTPAETAEPVTEVVSQPQAALVPGVLDLPASQGVRLIALALLEKVLAANGRLGDTADPEGLHDFRVALRRLRSFVRSCRQVLGPNVSPKTRRRLRRLAEATNQSRDLEVQLTWLESQRPDLTPRERTGLAWLRERLEERKLTSDRRFLDEIAKDLPRVEGKLREDLAVWPPEPGAEPTTAQNLGRLVVELTGRLRGRLARVRSVADQAETHAARIAGKRLRYLLELVAERIPGGEALIGRLKEFQDTTGAMHDADVLEEIVAVALREAAAEQGDRVSRAVRKKHEVDAATLRRERRRDPSFGLMAIAARTKRRKADAYQQLAAAWLGGKAEEMLEESRRAGAVLATEAHDLEGIEIERKYLLSGLPDAVLGHPAKEMDQGYLPGVRVLERLRRVQENGEEAWFRTIKLGDGIVRKELEDQTTREVYEAMWPLTEGRRLRKRRYVLPEGAFTWEIDEFLDRQLVLAEVELPTETTEVTIPAWLRPYLVREVTLEAEYRNSRLAT